MTLIINHNKNGNVASHYIQYKTWPMKQKETKKKKEFWKWVWNKNENLKRGMKEGQGGYQPRERDACSGHTRERKSQPRCDRRRLWRNRSWIRPKPKPFHPPRMSQPHQAKTGPAATKHCKQRKPSSSSSFVLCLCRVRVGSQQHNPKLCSLPIRLLCFLFTQ